jgi:hypothetical protein
MSFPWIHESEMDAERAAAAAGDILGDAGRAEQRKIDEMLERDPEFRAWADAKYLERWGIPRPHPEAEMEAGE